MGNKVCSNYNSSKSGLQYEVGMWVLKIKKVDVGSERWTLEAKKWILEVKKWILEARKVDIGSEKSGH